MWLCASMNFPYSFKYEAINVETFCLYEHFIYSHQLIYWHFQAHADKFNKIFDSRFDEKESVSGVQQLKSSVQKGIRTKLLDQFPHIEQYVDVILPKKDAFKLIKWQVVQIHSPSCKCNLTPSVPCLL